MLAVATWNVENLFRPGGEAGPTSDDAYERKLASLAATIERMAPDVLALQEVGEPAAFEDLRERLPGEWHAALSPDPDGRGIRVGFLSRLALRDVERVRVYPPGVAPTQIDDAGTTADRLGRGALRARVQAGDVAVDVVTCHLKSKLLSFPGGRFSPRDEGERARYTGYALARRAAEAITMRDDVTRRLDGHGRERALVLLGDLNDEPLAATTQILHGPPGSEIGSRGFDRPDAGDAQRLWNLAGLIPETRRFSRRYHDRGELIDHILVSHALVTRALSADTSHVELPSVADNPRARRDEPASDHAMVIAHFAVGQ